MEAKKSIKIDKFLLSIDHELAEKARKKAKKLNYLNFQQYAIELIRRDVNRKKVGGRPAGDLKKVLNVMTMKKVLTTKGKPFSI